MESRRVRSCVLLIVSAMLVVAIPGCGGCWSSQTAAEKKKAEEEQKEKEKQEKKKRKKGEKPKEDFTLGRVLVQPSEVKQGKADVNYVKRGHWVAATQQMRANNFDVEAELRSITADTSGLPFDVEHTNYALLFSRPVPLAKGTVKSVESLFFIPRERADSRPPVLRNELVPQRGGFQLHPENSPVSSMDEWQYLLVVLSSRQASFNILGQEVMNTIQPYYDELNTPTSDPPIQYYHVLRPVIDKRPPLPTNPLAWTSIAVILWDDIDPAKLDGPQQQAMLDWLHWGGHLLISGPNSLDRLKGSFLEPYLPATTKQTVNLTQAHFDELNQHWSLKIGMKPQINRNLTLVKEIVGVELELAPHGDFVPTTGELVAAGRVGNGRIVITGFSLASGAVQNWKNFDGFFNGALLMRPGREFRPVTDQFTSISTSQVGWRDPKFKDFRRESRLISNLRYFSRDMGFLGDDGEIDAQNGLHPYIDLAVTKIDPTFSVGAPGETPVMSTALETGPPADERFGGYLGVPRAGVGSWNDFSGAAIVARKHLTDAAGVKIPTVEFVAKVLGIYLLILVPINWTIFRAMRRVEWAWVAAPVIALIGAVTVVKLAQLDIGFVRYRTEIDLVELQPGYSRAHVSRYIALYTSLSTGYDMQFEDPSALVQPFAVSAQYSRSIANNLRPREVHFRQDANLHLSGLQVDSNSTNLVHAEQMRDTGGAIELLGDEMSGWRIKNGSELTLRDAGILRRSLDGKLFGCYFAELKPGATIAAKFEALQQPWIAQWDKTTVFQSVDESQRVLGELRLGRFAALAAKQLELQHGAVRLIAWTDKEMSGVAYSPDAPQVNGMSFVLAHLARGPLPPPEVDKNVIEDIKQVGNDPANAKDVTDPNAMKPDDNADLEQPPDNQNPQP